MSTRSGKRIHSSNDEDVVENSEFKNVIKTRSKRQKENLPETTAKHYVRYPSEENLTSSIPVEVMFKSTRKSKKYTLKEQNIPTDSETLQYDDRGEVRSTRRTRKIDVPEDSNIKENLTGYVPIEVMVKSTRKSKKHKLKEQNIVADPETLQHDDTGEVRSTRRTKKIDVSEDLNIVESSQEKEATVSKKKNKKKKVKSPFKEENIENESKPLILTNKKKSNTKKNKHKSSSFVVEEIIDDKFFNKSNVTNDSFHSAAGSSIDMDTEENSKKHNFIPENLKVKKIKGVSRDDKRDNNTDNDNEVKCPAMEKDCDNDHLKHRLNEGIIEILKDIKAQVDDIDNMTFEKENTLPALNNNLGSSSKKRKSMRKISCCNMEENSSVHIDNENKGFNISVNDAKLNSSSRSLNKTFDSIFNNKKSKNSIISDNLTALNITFEKDNSNKISNELNTGINDITYSGSKKRKSSVKNSTYDNIDSSIINLNATYEKEPITNNKSTPIDTANESSRRVMKQSSKHSLGEAVTSLNSTYDKNCKTETVSSSVNNTFDQTKLDTTFDESLKRNSIDQISPKAKSSLISSDTTDNSTSDITDDNSRISITSDDSKAENIINTTPVLIESSMDESVVANEGKKIEIVLLKRQNTFTETEVIPPPLRREGTYIEMEPTKHLNNKIMIEEIKSPPLIREGTFNTLETDLQSEIETTSPTDKNSFFKSMTPLKNNVNKTPPFKKSTNTTPAKRKSASTKGEVPMTPTIKSNEKTPRRKSLPSPGRTPFPPSKSSSKESNILNVTCTIEKSRRSSVADLAPRMTRVMFCSPVNNPAVVTQMKGKVIKSNLKGSNKSFVFEESVSEVPRSGRKRSYTQSAAEAARGERERKAHQHSVERLSRARTASASARLQVDTPTKKLPGAKAEPRRTKLPNFAALHQKQFQRMESLDECQERKAKRARRLLTPTGVTTTRTSPKEPQQPDTTIKKAETPKSKQSDAKPAYTRFGFKLNLDFNPFSIPSMNTESKPKENRPKDLNVRQPILPSLAGTTLRREIAKQTIMREKSFSDKRNVNRNDYRTYLKGVRTNRRFDMQMKMRNIRDK